MVKLDQVQLNSPELKKRESRETIVVQNEETFLGRLKSKFFKRNNTPPERDTPSRKDSVRSNRAGATLNPDNLQVKPLQMTRSASQHVQASPHKGGEMDEALHDLATLSPFNTGLATPMRNRSPSVSIPQNSKHQDEPKAEPDEPQLVRDFTFKDQEEQRESLVREGYTFKRANSVVSDDTFLSMEEEDIPEQDDDQMDEQSLDENVKEMHIPDTEIVIQDLDTGFTKD